MKTTTLILLVLLGHTAGCIGDLDGAVTSSESTDAASPPDDLPVVSPPAGCQETMCQFLYGVCVSSAPSGTFCASCPSSLAACLTTATNAICADDFGSPAPDGGPPCNADLSAAGCACGSDATCFDALLAVNTGCNACNEGSWVATCLAAACAGPWDDFTACASANGCTDADDCSACDMQVLGECFNAAEADTSDPGGCYSSSHACWVNPVCP